MKYEIGDLVSLPDCYPYFLQYIVYDKTMRINQMFGVPILLDDYDPEFDGPMSDVDYESYCAIYPGDRVIVITDIFRGVE